MSGHLSAEQMAVVGSRPQLPDGLAWPEIDYEVHDLGDIDQETWDRMSRGNGLSPRTPEGQAPPVAGYSAVFTRKGRWHYRHESDGGGVRSAGLDSRDEAVVQVRSVVDLTVAFWMEKVAWRFAGDVAEPPSWEYRRDSRPVIRCNGTHYTLGREPSETDLHAYGHDAYGFGGRQMAWRMLDDGRRVQSRNCWYQGRIPAEFVELLPDNAESVESDERIAERERMAAFREGWAQTHGGAS